MGKKLESWVGPKLGGTHVPQFYPERIPKGILGNFSWEWHYLVCNNAKNGQCIYLWGRNVKIQLEPGNTRSAFLMSYEKFQKSGPGE